MTEEEERERKKTFSPHYQTLLPLPSSLPPPVCSTSFFVRTNYIGVIKN